MIAGAGSDADEQQPGSPTPPPASPPALGQRLVGEVTRVEPYKNFGFLRTDMLHERVYFRLVDVKGAILPVTGDRVEFDLGTNSAGYIAHNLGIHTAGAAPVPGQPPTVTNPPPAPPATPAPPRPAAARAAGSALPADNEYLLNWASIPLGEALTCLADKALREPWHFADHAASSPTRGGQRYPILLNYLTTTFKRLASERKVRIHPAETTAAFHTGLANHFYEPLFAIFTRNDARSETNPGPFWIWRDFVAPGEERWGMMLAQNFNPLPEPPNYYADPTALIYDTRQGPPLVNWEHVLLDNLDRYPWQFLNQFTVAGVRLDAEEPADAAQRRSTIARFAAALRTDPSAQRKLMNQVTSAIDLSVKRTQWNYKTAIPMYYPVTNQLMLMLPLCLVDAERPDLALVLERTNAGSYLARTVLMLDWAYKNARLVCRPTSDWLIATEIQESPVDAPPVPA